jgi:hypothetical protein
MLHLPQALLLCLGPDTSATQHLCQAQNNRQLAWLPLPLLLLPHWPSLLLLVSLLLLAPTAVAPAVVSPLLLSPLLLLLLLLQHCHCPT